MDPRPELVIFDCDGVLVDSEPVSNRILADTIAATGLPIGPAEVARAFEGMRLVDIQAAVEERLGGRLPGDWIEDFEARRATAFGSGLDPIPGVAEVLARLRNAEIPICVASQASREKTELTLGLTGLASHFRTGALFSSRMVPLGKPSPDLFLLAAAEMGGDPARCVVVEDGVPGVRAARAAGMRPLGYAPDEKASRLAAEGATTFAAMAALPPLLGLA